MMYSLAGFLTVQADWSVQIQFCAGSARPTSPFRVSVPSFPGGGEEGLAARLSN